MIPKALTREATQFCNQRMDKPGALGKERAGLEPVHAACEMLQGRGKATCRETTLNNQRTSPATMILIWTRPSFLRHRASTKVTKCPEAIFMGSGLERLPSFSISSRKRFENFYVSALPPPWRHSMPRKDLKSFICLRTDCDRCQRRRGPERTNPWPRIHRTRRS